MNKVIDFVRIDISSIKYNSIKLNVQSALLDFVF